MKRRLVAGCVLALFAASCGGEGGATSTLTSAPASTTTSTTTSTIAPSSTSTTTTSPLPTAATTTTRPPVTVPEWASGARAKEFVAFLELVDAYLVGAGIPYAIDVERGVIGTGEEFALGLLTLWQKVAEAGAGEASAVVAEHFDLVFATIAANPGVPPTWEDGQKVIRLRMYDTPFFESIGDAAGTILRREISRDVFATVVLDLPSAVRPVDADDIAPWGVSEEVVFETALAATLDDPDLVVEPFFFDSGEELFSFHGSFYSSTAVLDIEASLETTGDGGALVIMPVSDVLVVHVVDETTSLDTFEELALIADSWFADGPSSLSPLVFWWRNGTLEVLGTILPGVGPGLEGGIGADFLEVVRG